MAVKVLMFGWEFPPHNSGGLGVACLGITRALSKEGFDITFVLPRTVPLDQDYLKFRFAGLENIKFRTINSPLSPYLTSGKYKDLFGDSGLYGSDLINEVRRYAIIGGKIAGEENHDIIYAHDWLSFGAGLEAKSTSGKPLIVHVHATEYDRCGGINGINKEVEKIEKAGMIEADCVITVSQLTKDTVIKYYGIPESKVIVVHNGIDENTFPYKSRGDGRFCKLKKAGYKLVLFVGRITLQKGPDYFVRAAKKVIENNDKVIFIMSGTGDMSRQIMQQAAYLGIGDKILFPGFLRDEELAEVYSAADLFVMPSVSEPFGITALEAMKMGVPVIVSKQSGVAEAVKNVIKVDFWDTEKMANEILIVLRDKSTHKSLRQGGLKEVSNINWGKAASKIKNIIDNILGWFKN